LNGRYGDSAQNYAHHGGLHDALAVDHGAEPARPGGIDQGGRHGAAIERRIVAAVKHADKLMAIKASRDQVNHSTGRGLVVLKTSVVDAEFDKLDLKLRAQPSNSRMVSMMAYEAGGAAGASLAISPGRRIYRRTTNPILTTT
jgi:hypothetical protein